MSTSDKILQRMDGQEPEPVDLPAHGINPVCLTVGELMELRKECKDPEHQKFLDKVIAKNKGDASLEVVMDKADLTCIIKGGSVNIKIKDGIEYKEHSPIQPPKPTPSPQK